MGQDKLFLELSAEYFGIALVCNRFSQDGMLVFIIPEISVRSFSVGENLEAKITTIQKTIRTNLLQRTQTKD